MRHSSVTLKFSVNKLEVFRLYAHQTVYKLNHTILTLKGASVSWMLTFLTLNVTLNFTLTLKVSSKMW